EAVCVGEAPLERKSRVRSEGLKAIEIRAEPPTAELVLRGELLVYADCVLVVVKGPQRGTAEICQVDRARGFESGSAQERGDAESTVVKARTLGSRQVQERECDRIEPAVPGRQAVGEERRDKASLRPFGRQNRDVRP